jgi:hypothetical protein
MKTKAIYSSCAAAVIVAFLTPSAQAGKLYDVNMLGSTITCQSGSACGTYTAGNGTSKGGSFSWTEGSLTEINTASGTTGENATNGPFPTVLTQLGYLDMTTGGNSTTISGNATFDWNIVINVTSPGVNGEVATPLALTVTATAETLPSDSYNEVTNIFISAANLQPITVTSNGASYTLSNFTLVAATPYSVGNTTPADNINTYDPTTGIWTVSNDCTGVTNPTQCAVGGGALVLEATVTDPPIPEPASLTLLGSTLGLFGILRRRRRKAA